MIPESYITEWSEKAPWGLNQQNFLKYIDFFSSRNNKCATPQ